MSRMATDQPWLASLSAVARPIPRAEAAPVRTAVRSVVRVASVIVCVLALRCDRWFWDAVGVVAGRLAGIRNLRGRDSLGALARVEVGRDTGGGQADGQEDEAALVVAGDIVELSLIHI